MLLLGTDLHVILLSLKQKRISEQYAQYPIIRVPNGEVVYACTYVCAKNISDGSHKKLVTAVTPGEKKLIEGCWGQKWEGNLYPLLLWDFEFNAF